MKLDALEFYRPDSVIEPDLQRKQSEDRDHISGSISKSSSCKKSDELAKSKREMQRQASA